MFEADESLNEVYCHLLLFVALKYVEGKSSFDFPIKIEWNPDVCY
jgi:hypothetical protein